MGLSEGRAITIDCVISDVGDILLDTTVTQRLRRTALATAYNANRKQADIIDEHCVYKKFMPYKKLGQTIIADTEAIELFFQDEGVEHGYEQYSAMANNNAVANEQTLLPGTVETLAILAARGIPFVTLSDSSLPGEEMMNNLNILIRNALFSQGKKMYTTRYLTACVSSKDLGVKKPSPIAFSGAISLASKITGEDYTPDKCLYIGHESKEIFGAIRAGMNVMAYRCCHERDSREIHSAIDRNHRQEYGGRQPSQGKFRPRMYHASRFEDLTMLTQGERD